MTLREVYEQRFTRTEELLATVVDLLQWVVHYSAAAVVKEPNRLREPQRVPRPGVVVEMRRQSSPTEVKRFMAALGR